MLRVLSRAQMQEFDRRATSQCGVAGIVLMENAGRSAAEIVARELVRVCSRRRPRVLVVAGPGNNGGDGYVVARRLLLFGIPVEVLPIDPEQRLSGDALANQRAFLGVGGSVQAGEDASEELARALGSADLVVDALFGTGLDRPLEGIFADAIRQINSCSLPKIALDIPSGVDADTGSALGVGLRADCTISFGTHKLGMLTPAGRALAGRIELVDIGVPPGVLSEVGESALLLEDSDVARLLAPRPLDAHKASAGRVLILAGSPGKFGAALLAAEGALRAGAGLVTLAGASAVVEALDRRVLEAMTAPIDSSALEQSLEPLLMRTDAVVIGPGIGLDDRARELVEFVIDRHTGPTVVDADAISHFRERPEALARAAGQLILTPHSAELGRLIGDSASGVESDRFAALTRAVRATEATVLLKGPHTLVAAPGVVPVVGREGTPALSTGGTGDVLSGAIGALACKLDATSAAFVAAYLHALAGELWARRAGSDRGLLAHELADLLPAARAELSQGNAVLPV